ncbi:hypothetical protein [Noviherbaspirillum agri]
MNKRNIDDDETASFGLPNAHVYDGFWHLRYFYGKGRCAASNFCTSGFSVLKLDSSTLEDLFSLNPRFTPWLLDEKGMWLGYPVL